MKNEIRGTKSCKEILEKRVEVAGEDVQDAYISLGGLLLRLLWRYGFGGFEKKQG